jgi:hypothetical protein
MRQIHTHLPQSPNQILSACADTQTKSARKNAQKAQKRRPVIFAPSCAFLRLKKFELT